MIDGYLTINELEEKWDVTPRSIRAMCANGQIAGASKLGREWVILSSVERPNDGSVTTGKYKNWRKKEV